MLADPVLRRGLSFPLGLGWVMIFLQEKEDYAVETVSEKSEAMIRSIYLYAIEVSNTTAHTATARRRRWRLACTMRVCLYTGCLIFAGAHARPPFRCRSRWDEAERIRTRRKAWTTSRACTASETKIIYQNGLHATSGFEMCFAIGSWHLGCRVPTVPTKEV